MSAFTKQAVEEWVDKQMPDFLNDLITITNIRSVAEIDSNIAPYGQGCIDVLNKMLEIGQSYGFNTRNYDNYVGCIELNDLKDDIGIWAHLDVVHEGEGWVYPPYQAQIKDNYVIGRGCQDNKSSAIVGLYTLRFLKEFNIPVTHNVKLFCGTCEEQGMYDLDYFTKHYPCPALSLVPDSGFPVCCGERGSFNGEFISDKEFSDDIIDFYTSNSIYMVPEKAVIVLKKSDALLEKIKVLPENVKIDISDNVTLTVTGASKNAFMPRGSIDAMLILLTELHNHDILSAHDDAIFSLCREINATYDGTALNVNCTDEISGPLVLTCVIAKNEDRHLKATFVSKFPISKNDTDFEGIVTNVCKERGYSFKVTRYGKANYFDPNNPIVGKLTSVYNDYMGLDTKPFVMSGGTYARKLPNAFAFGTGMPLPKPPEGLFLPGHGDYHQPDEAISITRMRNALVIYILSFLEIA